MFLFTMAAVLLMANVCVSQNLSSEYCSVVSSLLEDTCVKETSCQDACGSGLSRLNSLSYPGRRYCSCDYMCPVYRDCCQDFEDKCPEERLKLCGRPVRRLVSAELKCVYVRGVDTDMDVAVVVSCPDVDQVKTSRSGDEADVGDNNTPGETQRLRNPRVHGRLKSTHRHISSRPTDDCEIDETVVKNTADSAEHAQKRLSQKILVTDVEEDITYLNEEVFRCNNPGESTETRLKVWNKQYLSNYRLNATELRSFMADGSSSEEFQRRIFDVPAPDTQVRLCRPNLKFRARCGQDEQETVSRRICEHDVIDAFENKCLAAQQDQSVNHSDNKSDTTTIYPTTTFIDNHTSTNSRQPLLWSEKCTGSLVKSETTSTRVEFQALLSFSSDVTYQ